ncbi:MAG: aminotransferase class III-fold pyridoxal phosphate-dependent enzyme [Blastocatellia bacterium]|nr:aminotransferase class III-fold pyridoxal phosphate-dependent enzyme [Blastocatellia bacterium]
MNPNEQDAARLGRELYGLDATARALPGELDANFRLTAADGDEYVLKIMHPDRERALIEMQCRALAHLAAEEPGLRLPSVIPNLRGEAIAAVESPDGVRRLVWMLRYLPGRLMARTNPHRPEMLFSLGSLLGRLDACLAGFSHPAALRQMKWDLANVLWTRDHLRHIADPVRRALAEGVIDEYERRALPMLSGLRKSVIHNDANDYNVLVGDPIDGAREVVGLIDFGDVLHTCTVFEVAIAAAYAALDKPDPLAAAAQVIAGYHSRNALEEREIDLLALLIRTRLAVSVINSAWMKSLDPDDPYIVVSERPAWEALETLDALPPRLAQIRLRHACGLPPVAKHGAIVDWLRRQAGQFDAVIEPDPRATPTPVLDLSVGSLLLGADPAAFETAALSETIFREMARAGAAIAVGRYDEARALYLTPAFGAGHETEARRTIHLGIDLFAVAGTPVFAPLAGTVRCVANNDARLDYGPLIILAHKTDDGDEFFTLYGHLSEDSLTTVAVGQAVAPGQRIGRIGAPPTNGDWPPHLHFQIILDLLELDRDFPGVAYADQREVWKSLSPDPNLILEIPAERFPAPAPTLAETLASRRKHLGHNLSISYREPLKIVRGWKQYLYDDAGRAYLDVYNNVPLVGHSHPRVVRAVQQQMALLNTNTRYLHDNLTRYAERLTARMPAPLRVCYFLNSASEANELALRLARTHTGNHDIIVLDAAYHGHTNALIDISPYKFNGPGGGGRRPWVHVAPVADDYRGPYKRDDPEAGRKYADHVAEIIREIGEGGFAAFIAETLPSVGGQIVFPPGYLAEVYRHVRQAGGLCIADEVQVGFGRLGAHFWGFESQAVVPDIVVLGKPIGNAHPLAAVVTTPDIAASFHNGMEFFSTFGGNPVSCAAGLAVLDVMDEERLQQNALAVGNLLLREFRELMKTHLVIGDVRGSGLFLGLELVRNRETREPGEAEASYMVNRLRERGILAGTDGPHHNVIKLRPPLVFTESDALFLTGTMRRILEEDALRD